MTRPTKVHRVEVLIIDHDDLGVDGVRLEMENVRYPNHCLSPDVVRIDTREVDWDDEHPLNHRDTKDAAYLALFAAEEASE